MSDDEKDQDQDKEKGVPRLLVSAPVILRALASYLEVTGEADKFGQHLVAVIEEAGIDVEQFDTGGQQTVDG